MAYKIQDTIVIDDNRNGNFANFAQIRKPINFSPDNAAQNVATVTNLITLPYRSLYSSNHTFSRWQVSNNITFTDIYYDSGNTTPDITFSLPITLDINKDYFWRASFVNEANIVSEFSDATQFQTANVIINTPGLSIRHSGTGNVKSNSNIYPTVTLQTSGFSLTGNADTIVIHQSTDWRVIRSSNANIVYQSLSDENNLSNITLPDGILNPSVQYSFEARHRGNIFGVSAFASNVGNTASSFTPTALGEFFQGGYYFKAANIGGTCYYIVASPAASEQVFVAYQTSCSTINTTCADDGWCNTCRMTTSGTPAACIAWNCVVNGYDDWYLGAYNEIVTFVSCRCCFPPGEFNLFPGPPTGFFNCFKGYWSSTENNFQDAKGSFFSTPPEQPYLNGTWYYPSQIRKTTTSYMTVRPFRRIKF